MSPTDIFYIGGNLLQDYRMRLWLEQLQYPQYRLSIKIKPDGYYDWREMDTHCHLHKQDTHQ
jgi:hypothetical protein